MTFLQYYAFSLFAMGLNELEENMKSFLAPTDCRHRPDIRALENGDLGKNFLLINLSFRSYHYSVFIQLRQQSIRDYSSISDVFAERALRVWKNQERWVTDVHSICITVWENEEKLCSRTIFKLHKGEDFHKDFSNRRCYSRTVILGLVDAVFKCGCVLQSPSISIICCSPYLHMRIFRFQNPFFRLNRVYDLCNFMWVS